MRYDMVKKYPLNNGIPCMRHRCTLCCIETRMPLSRSDIRRILKVGYKLVDFAVKTAEGWRLKNRSGKCVFLSEKGCEIYSYRPEGCRLYPIIYEENSGTTVLDDLCPCNDEFKVNSRDIERLVNLLALLEKEKRKNIAVS